MPRKLGSPRPIITWYNIGEGEVEERERVKMREKEGEKREGGKGREKTGREGGIVSPLGAVSLALASGDTRSWEFTG